MGEGGRADAIAISQYKIRTEIKPPTEIDAEARAADMPALKSALAVLRTADFPERQSAVNALSEAIDKLISQAKGSRAVRTVVGAPFGSDKANEGVAPVQAKVVEALGLSHLEKVA